MGRDGLDLLEVDVVRPLTLGETVNIDDILHLIHKVEELTIRRKAEVTRCRLQLTAERVDLTHPSVHLIKAEDAYLVDPEVCDEDILLIVGHTCAGYVWTEGPLCDGADALIEDAIDDRTDGTVRIQCEQGRLAIVVAGDHQVLIELIDRKVTSTHATDVLGVQLLQRTVLEDAEGNHALIRDGIQCLLISRCDEVGGVVHLDLGPLREGSLLYIDITDGDALCIARVAVGTDICHVLFFTHFLPLPTSFRAYIHKIVFILSQFTALLQ